MAIQQFGESLLSDIRERNERERKRARRRAEKEAMLGLGIAVAGKVGEQMFSKNTQNFLQSEPFMAQNIEYKTNLKNANKDNKRYSAYEQDNNYFVAEFIEKNQASYETAAAQLNPLYSKQELNKRIMLDAQAYSEEQVDILGKRINAARKFIETSGNDENAYVNLAKAERPTGFIDAAVKGLGNFVTGGTLHDSALNSNLYARSKDYEALYKENPIAAINTVQRVEQLIKDEGMKFADAPAIIDKAVNKITVSDGFGGTKEVSAQAVTKGGRYVGHMVMGTNEFMSAYAPAQIERNNNTMRAVPSVEQSYQIQAQVNEIIVEDQKEALENLAVATIGKETDNTKKVDAVRQRIYGNLAYNAGQLMQDYGLTRKQAFVMATEAEILRQQALRGGTSSVKFQKFDVDQALGFEVETNSSTVSPLLMLAAVDSLESKNVLGYNTDTYKSLRETLDLSLAGNSPEVEQLIQTFDALDPATQANMLRFYSQFPTLTAPRTDGENEMPSVIDRLKNVFPELKNVGTLQIGSSRLLGQ